MIILKSPSEIELMRTAGRVIAECLDLARERIAPGMRLADLDGEIDALIVARGGRPSFLGYLGYPRRPASR